MIARRPLSIDPARTAVLVVDLQEEQHGPDFSVAGFADVLANAARVIAAARGGGIRVLHARYVRDFSALPVQPFEPLGADGGPAFSAAGSQGIAICPEVAPASGEAVFDKQAASCFANPALADHLAGAGVRTLIVCGVWTEACVALTVKDAMALGLKVLLVKDACGSGTEFMHRSGVLNIANRLYGGAIVSSEAVERLARGEAAEAWVCERPIAFLFAADDVDGLYDLL